MSEPEVLIRVEGKAGRITLNRPEALNALSYSMVLEIEKALLSWESDPAVSLVIVDATGERAFCAGGDIEEMYKAGRAGDYSYGAKFWADEYRLNAYIGNYPKPYVAIMHGFVMGGGVGISAHGSHRIVTETSMVAMPECSIGLIPDVGGTHILGNAPGSVGEFCGLTGFRLNAADAIFAGFADIYVETTKVGELIEALSDVGDLSFIETFASAADDGKLEALEDEINAIFSRRTVGEIIEALENTEGDWAQHALKSLSHAAPLSLVCTLSMVHQAREKNDLKAALDNEYRFVTRSKEHGEFLEGIRAAIIDKDRKPSWRYPTLDDIPSGLIDSMLAPVESD